MYRSLTGVLVGGMAAMQSRQLLAPQPLHVQLHDNSLRFGSALAWITVKQATVLAGIVALLRRHIECAIVRLPVMMQLVEVQSCASMLEMRVVRGEPCLRWLMCVN